MLKTFDLWQYWQEHNETKIRAFLDYLKAKYGEPEKNEFEDAYLPLIDEDDLIESLESYIHNNKITGQGTANTYVATVTEFFNELAVEYNITNEIFTDVAKKNQFTARAKGIISTLKKTERKDVATDKQYEDLITGLNNYMYDEGEIYNEIDTYKENNSSTKTYIVLYHRFVSVIAVKLILKYAFKNNVVVNLYMENIDMINQRLLINDVSLPLDDELFYLLQRYIKLREYILSIYNLKEKKLFIKQMGVPYNDRDYSIFLKIMGELVQTQSGDHFAAKRIIEMLEKGIDVNTIQRVTGRAYPTILKLLEDNNSVEVINSNVNKFFAMGGSIDKKFEVKKNTEKECKCPFCGEVLDATSENWVLVEYSSSDRKYLACRKCKGKNGRIH